jgi:Domain of unknown function (DUF1902)
MINWTVGFPFWKLAAKAGFTIVVPVKVAKDEEANVYIAINDVIGLAVEGNSIEALYSEVDTAIPALLELAHAATNNSVADIRQRRHLAPA